MNVNEAGLRLIKEKEGLQLSSYPDIASDLAKICKFNGISIYNNQYTSLPDWNKHSGAPWTIGYGSTRDESGNPIQPNTTWSQAQCDSALLNKLNAIGSSVLKKITVPLNENQYSALCVFCYNVGLSALDRSVGKNLNGGNYSGAADSILLYNKGGTPPQVIPGLSKRREDERTLFLTPPSSGSSNTSQVSSIFDSVPTDTDIGSMLSDIENKILK